MATGVTYAADVPEHDRPVAIAPGMLWLRTSLPFALDHINLWILDDGDAWTLIDTGVGNASTRTLWQNLLAGPLAGRSVGRLLVTHFHPDHMGQAGWLAEVTGAPLLMARTEWLMGRMLSLDDTAAFVEAGAMLDIAAGLDVETVRLRRDRGNLFRRSVVPPPASFQRLAAGDEIMAAGTSWRVIIGEGHAPEQVTLYSSERRILIAADQLLPRITPVVGVWPHTPDADPLGDFLLSLDRYADLPEDCLVLPSHGRPYRGLHRRMSQLREHHEERLDRTLDLCGSAATAAAVMRGLFDRELGLQHVGFALAETLAHLNALERTGTLARETDTNGIWRYRRT
jgi:glyoxylase-like metal-dependent hydrolase (beta-lactamase superfamily II)